MPTGTTLEPPGPETSHTSSSTADSTATGVKVAIDVVIAVVFLEQSSAPVGEHNEPWRRVELDSTQESDLLPAETPSPDPSTAAKQPAESSTNLKKQVAQLRAHQAVLEERLAQEEQNTNI